MVAHGLSRAAPPILRSIGDLIDGIAIYQVGRWYKDCELDQELAPLCTTLPRIPTMLCKVLRKCAPYEFGVGDTLPALLLAPLVRRSRAESLLAFVGADAGALSRAANVAARARKSCTFYVVDDFLAAMRISGAEKNAVQRTMERAGNVLREAEHVFTISDGLTKSLGEMYGISPTTLGLVFEPAVRPIVTAQAQIIYVGSINFLYAGGLLDLFGAVGRIRQTTGTDLRVRLTVPYLAAERELGKLPPFVNSTPAWTSEELAREIASSLFAFLPYSFSKRDQAMVTTSFPSKSMEYFAYARSIVVYGPDYGVTTRLFWKRKLPSVACSPRELEQMIRFHLTAWPEHSPIYRKYLAEAHSLDAARRTVCAGLRLDVP